MVAQQDRDSLSFFQLETFITMITTASGKQQDSDKIGRI
jgi:hypothetical protein